MFALKIIVTCVVLAQGQPAHYWKCSSVTSIERFSDTGACLRYAAMAAGILRVELESRDPPQYATAHDLSCAPWSPHRRRASKR